MYFAIVRVKPRVIPLYGSRYSTFAAVHLPTSWRCVLLAPRSESLPPPFWARGVALLDSGVIELDPRH